MPGQRAEGTVVPNFPMPRDLLDAAKAKAARTGVSLAEIVRRKLAEWLAEDE